MSGLGLHKKIENNSGLANLAMTMLGRKIVVARPPADTATGAAT